MVWDVNRNLNILLVGNSFSNNTKEYLYEIFTSLGFKKVKIGNLYYPGCSLDQHYSFGRNDQPVYDYSKTTEAGSWQTKPFCTMISALEDESWDYISLQQQSANAGQIDSFSNLDNLMEFIQKYIKNSKFKFVFNMTWSYGDSFRSEKFRDFYNYDQMQMFKAILEVAKKIILPHPKIEIMIPNFMSIQNTKTSKISDKLYEDGLHLNKGVGSFIAGLTFATFLVKTSPEKINYKPSIITDEELQIAIESVQNAQQNLFEITESKYKKRA